MDPDTKIAWLHEHYVEALIGREIDRIFQRLNYFLVASSFFIGAFVAILVAKPKGEDLQQLLQAVGWVVIAGGLTLSVAFYAINSWNSSVVARYRHWIRCLEGPRWLFNDESAPCLRQGMLLFENKWKDFVQFAPREFFSCIVKDLFVPDVPAWFARYIPFVMTLLWLALLLVYLPWTRPLWFLWAASVPLGAAVVGAIAVVDP